MQQHLTTNKHPVSRVITTCGVHNPNHARRILQNATAYIDHMEDLTRKIVCRTMARIEAVFLLEEHIPITLALRDFYYMPAVHKLLEQIPIVLPFKKNSQVLGLSHVVHPVASYLTTILHSLLRDCKGKRGFTNSWMAFQCELALEELFFGRPKKLLAQLAGQNVAECLHFGLSGLKVFPAVVF